MLPRICPNSEGPHYTVVESWIQYDTAGFQDACPPIMLAIDTALGGFSLYGL